MGSAIAGGMSIAGGLYNTIEGAKEKRNAAAALANYQRQQLTNVADGLQVSTIGSDLQRAQQSQLAAGQVDALRGAGARGIVGGLGIVNANSNAVNGQIAANLDMQQKQIDQMRAEDAARIRQMQENRENADIAALSSQYQSGKQQQQMGFGQIIRGSGALAKGIAGKPDTSGLLAKPTQQPINPTSAGFATQEYPSPSVSPNPTYYPQFGYGGNGMFASPNMLNTNYSG
jgi:hypothetical protein